MHACRLEICAVLIIVYMQVVYHVHSPSCMSENTVASLVGNKP